MCEEQKKDFSLLRPFDLEAAKRREPVCTFRDDEPSVAVHIFDSGKIAIDWASRADIISYAGNEQYELRMAPLCWVEGRPVYKGDVLYWKPESRRVVVAKVDNTKKCPLIDEDGRPYKIENLTGTQPKVKREGWVNIYPKIISNETIAKNCNVYASKEVANCEASPNRIACIRIEWEE